MRPTRYIASTKHAQVEMTGTVAACRITENMLNRLVNGAGWKALSEIDEPSTQKILAKLQGERNYTVAHVNKFLTKLKSFLHWCVPDRLPFNPLRKLKKGNERKALKRRAKRPLTPHEVLSLLQKVSSRRRLKYAIAIYAGLRRNEAAKLTWGISSLTLSFRILCFVRKRQKQAKRRHCRCTRIW